MGLQDAEQKRRMEWEGVGRKAKRVNYHCDLFPLSDDLNV